MSCLIGSFYNQTQKSREEGYTFTDQLNILMCKIVVLKLELEMEGLKHQYAHNLCDPYHGAIVQWQFLSSPETYIFTHFRVQLVLMFGNRGKCSKPVNTVSSVVSLEVEEFASPQEYLSHDSHKYQNKIDAQAVKAASMKKELGQVLREKVTKRNVQI